MTAFLPLYTHAHIYQRLPIYWTCLTSACDARVIATRATCNRLLSSCLTCTLTPWHSVRWGLTFEAPRIFAQTCPCILNDVKWWNVTKLNDNRRIFKGNETNNIISTIAADGLASFVSGILTGAWVKWHHPVRWCRMSLVAKSLRNVWQWMVLCKAAVSPLLTHWRYCSLAQSHRYNQGLLQYTIPDSKVHGANRSPTRAWQDSSGTHVGPTNLAV